MSDTSRIRDPSLAENSDASSLDWYRKIMPVTAQYGDEVARLNLTGRTIACCQHLLGNSPATILPLVQAGARVRIAACNPDSTVDSAAALLVANGVEVWAWNGMSENEFREGIEWAASEPADAISDMGGELIAATIERGGRVDAALEATTSGLHRLADLALPFPVFNWNDAALKNLIHNRHHVGMEIWPMFSAITGLAIHGRSVLVLGFGPVARGVALRAIALGAIVTIIEPDPVRALEARHYGCRVTGRQESLASADIVVTATGRERVLGAEELPLLRSGAIVFNVGHSNHEIDIDWLASFPETQMRPHVVRYDLESSHIYLLNKGSLLNLATDVMPRTEELFDPFSAMMTRGLAWILEGNAAEFEPGMHLYPHQIEQEIAERSLATRS